MRTCKRKSLKFDEPKGLFTFFAVGLITSGSKARKEGNLDKSGVAPVGAGKNIKERPGEIVDEKKPAG